ncbi:MAG: hypothetical protein JW953_14550 [Anaerolineae bacterium]|nr:hypothetical protein [Anaerolineae bacterium]
MKKQQAGRPANNKLVPALIRRHPSLSLALLIYLFLASSYFFIVPIFEGPDEWTHTGHVKYIAEGNGLPVMLPGKGIWGGQQPPLYYTIGALLIQPFELDGVAEYETERRNPHASIGYALDPGNKNNYLHPSTESFPYRGLALTVHVLRLYSMLFGVIAIIFTYLTALELFNYQAQNTGPTARSSRFRPNSQITNRKSQIANHKSQVANRKPLFTIHHSPSTIPNSQFTIHNSQFTIHNSQFPTLVALFVACQPMFAFITASVANEPANIAFCAVGLWLAQRYVLHGPTPHWGRAAALGVTLGLISLSKMTGLAFGLVAVEAILIVAIATRKQPGAARLLWRDGLIIGFLFLAVGGWWYWRNYQLYHDFFQQGLYKIYFNVDPQPLTLNDFLYTLSTGEVSFWATFGWLNIAAPEWVYSVYRIISRIGLLGILFIVVLKITGDMIGKLQGRTAKLAKKQPATLSTFSLSPPSSLLSPLSSLLSPLLLSPLLLHLTFPIALAFSLTRLVAIEGGMQGRQLLPALGSMAILIGWGWWMLTPQPFRRAVTTILSIILLSIAVWMPYGVVAPAYIPPPLLAETDLPADLSRLDLTYNDELKLIGVAVEAKTARPGERVNVTAYWQALKPMDTNYSVFVHLVGRDHTPVGQMNTYPGLGLRPTTTLAPGQIVQDTYPVLVNGDSAAPTRLLVNLGLFDFNEPGRPGIQPVAPDGNPAPPTVGQLKLAPARWPSYPNQPPLAEFAGHIRLLDTSFQNCRSSDNDCQITLVWSAHGRPAADYTVFIQLWRNGEFSAGFDSPPLNNNYPTGLWDAGEIIIDPHLLDLSALPSGEYRVLAGLYDFSTGERLPAALNGDTLPDNAVELSPIKIR